MHFKRVVGQHDSEVWGVESVVGQPQLDTLELEPRNLAGVAPLVEHGGVRGLGLVHGAGLEPAQRLERAMAGHWRASIEVAMALASRCSLALNQRRTAYDRTTLMTV